MGIKCSLLGHQYTETDVAEEREEQGSEVVITIKEIETCARCGAERIVSENKEVTSLETAGGAEDVADEPADDAAAETASGPSPSTGTSPAPDMDAVEDDAELLEDEAEPDTADAEPEPAAESATEPTADAEPEPEPTAAEDDAVILDDEDDEPEREPGEWPEEAESGATAEPEGESWPDDEDEQADESEPVAENTPGEAWPDEAESGPEESGGVTDDMEWPDEGRGGDGDEWEPSESLTQKIDQAEVEPAGSATVTVPEGEFECPECGFRTSVESTSLRAGDFCPECHRGSLEHVPDGETRKE